MTRPKPADDPKSRHVNLLEGLIGTGETKAELLLDHFGSAGAAIDALENNPNAILDVKGFGPEFVPANRRLVLDRL
jgi:ERCC4-type nuclease